MTEFQLDTSGVVCCAPFTAAHLALGRTRVVWSDLSPLAQGSLEALLRQLAQQSGPWTPREGWRDTHWPGFSDLAPETLARIIEICPGRQGATVEDGATFWREQQEGQFEDFPPVTVYLGDDGKVRFQ